MENCATPPLKGGVINFENFAMYMSQIGNNENIYFFKLV